MDGEKNGAPVTKSSPYEETLARLEAQMVQLGYRVEVDEDGTKRLIRPDGTVAVIATRRPAI